METIWQISSVLWFSGRDKEKKTAREGNGGEIYKLRRHPGCGVGCETELKMCSLFWAAKWEIWADVLQALVAQAVTSSSSQLLSPAWAGTMTAPSRLIPGKGMQVRWKGRHNNVLGEGDMSLVKIIKGLHMKNKSTPCHKASPAPSVWSSRIGQAMEYINDWQLPMLCAERRVEVLIRALSHRTCRKFSPCHGNSTC